MRLCLMLVLLLCSISAFAKQYLVVVTLDGVRWQEVFSGADAELINNQQFVKHPNRLKEAFWHEDEDRRKRLLMPFFWDTIAKQGTVIGDRRIGSEMRVANPWYFSYPGYSEIFTGVVDERLNSNEKVPNPNVSFIEYLAKHQGYEKAAVFAGWDVFPAIFNTQRSGLHVNAGYMSSDSPSMRSHNLLQAQMPKLWHNVRFDAFTYAYAKAYLQQALPGVLVLALGETDDFAHDGRYDQYLMAARRSDEFIGDLWATLQAHPTYRGKTTMLITTDHGRGSGNLWQHHASVTAVKGYLGNLSSYKQGIVGSDHIWMAAIGPGIKAKGVVKTNQQRQQVQIAATALTLMGFSPAAFRADTEVAIKEFIE